MSAPGGGIEGRLEIRLSPRDRDAAIVSTRPLHAARIFEGKTVGETLDLIPILFNICGQAQAIAAVRAIESAAGTPASDAVERARDRLKQIETLREHLWRVLLDWPAFLGEPPASDALAVPIKLLADAKRAIDPQQTLLTRPGLRDSDAQQTAFDALTEQLDEALTHTLFGRPPVEWERLERDEFDGWLRAGSTSAARLPRQISLDGWQALGRTDTAALPDLDSARLRERLDDDNAEPFIAAPSWDGGAWETGPAARLQQQPLLSALSDEFGRGLIVRLVARLIEIARLLDALRDPTHRETRFSELPGLSQLEAARGRLCHRVALDGERIVRYRILAPTEWNFGPDGPALAALRGIDAVAPATARAQAELLIHAIDPCVGYNLSVEDI